MFDRFESEAASIGRLTWTKLVFVAETVTPPK